MLRALYLLLIAAVVITVALPFVLTSLARDAHGITIPGTVYHKSEFLKVHYSDWELSRDITIQYTIPETSSVGFFTVHPDAEHFDALRTKQPVDVRYLPRKDVPQVPLSKILADLHALPTARLESVPGVPVLERLANANLLVPCAIIAVIVALLILKRITRWRPLGWSAGIAGVSLIGFLIFQGFPNVTPEPVRDVRLAAGVVKAVERIDKLFAGTRSRGVIADQPIDVVSVEFVPQGRTEPVLAVDLVDRGSIPNLRLQSAVNVKYEAASPRTAYIEGATRNFPVRNFRGTVVTGILSLAVIIALLGAVVLLGRGYDRLTKR